MTMPHPPHSKDLRKGRYSQTGGVYLLTWVTSGREKYFADWVLGRLVVASLRRMHEQSKAESLAFVVMPDHVHWLVTLGNLPLEDLMRDTKSHSGFYVKRHIEQQGGNAPKAIWQEGYHDHALREEEDILEVARYIVMNPVRAGLVRSVREYPLWDAKWL